VNLDCPVRDGHLQLWPFHGQGPQQLWKLEEVAGAQSGGAAAAQAGEQQR
jgi:hypothetical protein